MKKISRDCDVIPSSQYGSLEENDVNKQGQVFFYFFRENKVLTTSINIQNIFGNTMWNFWYLIFLAIGTCLGSPQGLESLIDSNEAQGRGASIGK